MRCGSNEVKVISQFVLDTVAGYCVFQMDMHCFLLEQNDRSFALMVGNYINLLVIVYRCEDLSRTIFAAHSEHSSKLLRETVESFLLLQHVHPMYKNETGACGA